MKHKLNIITIVALVLLWLVLAQAQGLAAEYYLDAVNGNDANPGTLNQPWATISYAVSGSSPVGPGDIIYVRQGIYREEVTVRVNGQAGNRITIKNYPGETPIIDGTKTITGWTQCNVNDEGLMVNGVINPNYANIYWAEIDVADVFDIESVVLLEDGKLAFVAQKPNQSEPVVENINEYEVLTDESRGLREYIIDSDLTEADDYWNGAFIYIRMLAGNNVIVRRRIADFDSTNHRIYFDTPLPWSIIVNPNPTYSDSYAIRNHPHILDKPGEYYYTTTPSNGKYKVYLWPLDTNHLADKTGLSVRKVGFIFANSYGNYVTIDGFEIRGQMDFYQGGMDTGGIIFRVGYNHDGLIVRNCYIHDLGGDGAILLYNGGCVNGVGDIVENNRVENFRWGRGIHIPNSKNSIVRKNYVNNTTATCIFLQGSDHIQIINNTVGGAGNHGNGISVYQQSSNVLVANNVIDAQSPLTLSSTEAPYTSNVTIYNNIIHGTGLYALANWATLSGRTIILNNVLLGGSGISKNSDNEWIIKNNVLDGIILGSSSSGWGDHSYNLYTGHSWTQTPVYGWSPGEGETDNILNKDNIFEDYNNFDFHLKDTSPAIDNGTDISSIIAELQLKFPDFDFYQDIEGNPRPQGSGWDIGPYQYGSASVLYGDVNEDAEISAFDAALAAHIAVDLGHPDIKNRAAAEVSGDGEVSAYDAALIAQRAVGLIEKFPVEGGN